jgi:hypothetical protein
LLRSGTVRFRAKEAQGHVGFVADYEAVVPRLDREQVARAHVELVAVVHGHPVVAGDGQADSGGLAAHLAEPLADVLRPHPVWFMAGPPERHPAQRREVDTT